MCLQVFAHYIFSTTSQSGCSEKKLRPHVPRAKEAGARTPGRLAPDLYPRAASHLDSRQDCNRNKARHGEPEVGEESALAKSPPGLSEHAVSGTVHCLFGRGTGLKHQGKDDRDSLLSHLPTAPPALTRFPTNAQREGTESRSGG